MKTTFHYRTEWSDWSEHSPQSTGQFPCAAILPDGERVKIDGGEREVTAWTGQYRPKNAYIQIHANIRFRESWWGDDGSRRMGRAGGKLELLTPKGSAFLFAQYCPGCGDQTGEVGIDELTKSLRAPDKYCADCKAWAAEQDHLIEEARREQQEWEREQDKAWTHE